MSSDSKDADGLEKPVEDPKTDAVLVSEVEREGRELLLVVEYMENVNFSDSQKMRSILWELIKVKGTKFYGATIEEATDGVNDVCRYMEAKVKDVQGRETYHIWFARKDGKWVLKYREMPQT